LANFPILHSVLVGWVERCQPTSSSSTSSAKPNIYL